MKTLKKALSIILGLAMVLSCVAGMQVSAAAEGTLKLSVGTATVADGVVTVPVVVDENTGFQALTATVDYDNTVLTLVGAEKAAFVEAEDSAVFGPTDAEKFKMMWAFALSADVTATGTIATLTFNVVEGADVDTTDIDLEVTEAWDAAGNAVTATAVDGTVTFAKACEHEWEVTAATPATGTGSSTSNNVETAKGSIEFKCVECGETKTEEVSWWNRYTFNYYNINMASQIELVFNLRESRLTETAGNYEDVIVKAVTSAATEDVTTFVTDVLSFDKVTQSGNLCYPVAVGVPAKQLTDDITAVAFVKKDGVWYSGTPKTNSVEDLCHSLYANITETERTLYANLLTYGSKAQTYFTYKTDDLADANLGDYASYVTSGNPTLVNDYVNKYTDPCIRSTTQALSMAAKTEAMITFRLDKMTTIPALSQVTATAVYADGDEVVTATYGSDTFADAS